jgi:hypothetical protein
MGVGGELMADRDDDVQRSLVRFAQLCETLRDDSSGRRLVDALNAMHEGDVRHNMYSLAVRHGEARGRGELMAARRSYGTGNLRVRRGSRYGQWWVGDRRVQRKLGPKREPRSREGLTRKQAEAELRRRIEATEAAPRLPPLRSPRRAGDWPEALRPRRAPAALMPDARALAVFGPERGG